jgi:hypothetical protein
VDRCGSARSTRCIARHCKFCSASRRFLPRCRAIGAAGTAVLVSLGQANAALRREGVSTSSHLLKGICRVKYSTTSAPLLLIVAPLVLCRASLLSRSQIAASSFRSHVIASSTSLARSSVVAFRGCLLLCRCLLRVLVRCEVDFGKCA